MAISWFWFLRATYLSVLTARFYLNGTSAVAFLLALFFGRYCHWFIGLWQIIQPQIEIGIVPMGSLGISVFGFLMAVIDPRRTPDFDSFKSFVSYSELWPLFAYLLLLGMSGWHIIHRAFVLFWCNLGHSLKLKLNSSAGLNLSITHHFTWWEALFLVSSSWVFYSFQSLVFALLAVFNTLVMFAPVLSGADLCFSVSSLGLWLHTMYRVKHKNLHNLPRKRWCAHRL